MQTFKTWYLINESTPKSHFPLPASRQAGILPRLCVAATAEQGRGTFYKLLIYRLSPFRGMGVETLKIKIQTYRSSLNSLYYGKHK